MSPATAEVLGEAGFDWESIVPEETVEAVAPEPEQPAPAKRRGRPPGSGSGRRRPAAKTLEQLQRRLSSEMFQAGTMVGFALPVTGMYTCQESDSFTKAVVQLAASRPEWIDALRHVADIQPGITVGRFAFGLGASVGVDRGRIDPERRVLQFLGVTAAWQALQNNGNIEEGNAYAPPPAAFRPVS